MTCRRFSEDPGIEWPTEIVSGADVGRSLFSKPVRARRPFGYAYFSNETRLRRVTVFVTR